MAEQKYNILDGAYTVKTISLEYKTTFWRKKYIKKFFYVYRGSGVLREGPVLEAASELEFELFLRGLVEGYNGGAG